MYFFKFFFSSSGTMHVSLRLDVDQFFFFRENGGGRANTSIFDRVFHHWPCAFFSFFKRCIRKKAESCFATEKQKRSAKEYMQASLGKQKQAKKKMSKPEEKESN